MAKIILKGKLSYKLRSVSVLILILLTVLFRRALGRTVVQEWSIMYEIATLFWRAQFNYAFTLKEPAQSREYFDSLYFVTGEYPNIERQTSKESEPKGDWFTPRVKKSEITMLYLHGGGYAFYAEATRNMIAMLADTLEITIFAPDYRLTPECIHPAQLDDAMNAYCFLLERGIPPENIIACGDSAGGHLVLMMLIQARKIGLPQPALGIALSPWTDTGLRGISQFGNDPYDLVQGYMTLQFAKWLKGNGQFNDWDISPIYQYTNDICPLYLQAGGKEILVDMIYDFATTVKKEKGKIRLDIWEHMNHEFQAYGQDIPESREAIEQIRTAITWATQFTAETGFPCSKTTIIDTLYYGLSK